MHDRSATELLDLDGFVVLSQTIEAGERWLLVETTADVAGCSSCGVVATGHGRSVVQVRDLPISGTPMMRLVWRRRRWRCLEVLRQMYTASCPPACSPRSCCCLDY